MRFLHRPNSTGVTPTEAPLRAWDGGERLS